MHAEGTAAVHGQSRLRPWGGAGLFLRTDWRPVGPLILTAEAGALAPLLREDFFFSPENLPNSIVYKAPAVTARAGIGVGVRFP